MILHKHNDDFISLIQETAEAIKLPEIYIEKDYWVTSSLKNLSESDFVDNVVFKGGTSLSKAYDLIHRFSEDIDLVIVDTNGSDSKQKKLIKDVEKVVAKNLQEISGDSRVSKGSKFRKTVHEYPKSISDLEFGDASPQLLIEINSFSKPDNYASYKIQSLISRFLKQHNKENLIEKYELGDFQINVLSVEQTLVEKIIRCIKDSYQTNKIDLLSKNIRHLYDICQILNNERYRHFVESEGFHTLFSICIENEKENQFENAACLNKPLGQAPLFIEIKQFEKQLKSSYNNEFSELVYGLMPRFEEIIDSLSFIRRQFD